MNWRYFLCFIIIIVAAALLLAQNPTGDSSKVKSASKLNSGSTDKHHLPIKGGNDSVAVKQIPLSSKSEGRDSVNKAGNPLEQITSEEMLHEKYPLAVIDHNRSGAVSGIWGKIVLSNPTGDLETDAVALMNSLAPLFGYESVLSEYRVTNKSDYDVFMQQYYQNVPVYDGDLHVGFLTPTTVINIGVHYVKNIDVSPIPSITIEQAESIAAQDFGGDRGAQRIRHGEYVGIKKFDGQIHLFWGISIADTSGTAAFYYYIDAHTGEILDKSNQMQYVDTPRHSESQGRRESGNSLDDCPLTFSDPYIQYSTIARCDEQSQVAIKLKNSNTSSSVSGNYTFYLSTSPQVNLQSYSFTVPAGYWNTAQPPELIPGEVSVWDNFLYTNFAGLSTGNYNVGIRIDNDASCNAILGSISFTRHPLDVALNGTPSISDQFIPYNGSVYVDVPLINDGGDDGSTYVKVKVFDTNNISYDVSSSRLPLTFTGCNALRTYNSGYFTPQNLFHTFQTGTIWIRVYQEMNGSDVLLWSKDLYVQMECATGSGVGDINT